MTEQIIPNYYFTMLLVNKNSEVIQLPYYAPSLDVYKKFQDHVILGVIKHDYKTKAVVSIEQTPILNAHAGFIPPETLHDDQKLWRYMHWFKFESLIKSSQLFLSRIDMFEDNLEGVSPESCEKSILIDNRFLDQEKKNEQVLLYRQRILDGRKTSFVCCWHVNNDLNSEMWDKYGSGLTNSIAIQTTVGQLRKSFKVPTPPIVFEKIRYFEEPFFNQEVYWFPSLFKTKDFEFENEYRSAVYVGNPFDHKFLMLNIDPTVLIQKVYLHPNSTVDDLLRLNTLLKDTNMNLQIEKGQF